MPLPPMRYTSAGPMPAQANTSAAEAQSRALQDVGNVLANVGQQGFRIAQQVRRADEAKKESELFTSLDEQAAQFANKLLTRQDTDNWVPEWKGFMNDVNKQAKTIGLSNEAQGRMQIRLQEWGSTRSIRFEGMAALKKIESTKFGLNSDLEFAAGRNDREGVARNLQLRRESGIYSPEEMTHYERAGERQLSAAELEIRIMEDPQGIAEAAASPDFLKLPGNEHLTEADRQRALQKSDSFLRQQVTQASEEFQDLMAMERVSTPEDIDRQFGQRVPPRVLGAMKDALARDLSAAEQSRRATPGYQAETVGRASVMLADLNPSLEGFDANYVEIDSIIRTLPDGAAKTELTRNLQEKRDGTFQSYGNARDIARRDIIDARKGGFFGAEATETTLGALLDDGFIRNHDRLEGLGFSEEQAAEIIGWKKGGRGARKGDDLKERGLDGERVERFRLLWKDRPNKDAPAGYAAEVAALLRARAPLTESISRTDPAAAREADRKAGEILTKLEVWLKDHPDASDEEIIRKRYELAAGNGLERFTDHLLEAPPMLPLPGLEPGRGGSAGSLLPPR